VVDIQYQRGLAEEIPFFFAMGLFGQFIIIVPELDMVAAFVSENYSDTMRPIYYFREFIVRLWAIINED
jgi:CubicO group peptidase (beta-lactamase class C family)